MRGATIINFHISTSAPSFRSGNFGDIRFALDLGTALCNAGHACEYYNYLENPKLTGTDDVILRITGRFIEDPVDGAPNMLWVISHPESFAPGLFQNYQKIYVASKSFGAWVQENYQIPQLSIMMQATDVNKFHPTKTSQDIPKYKLLFVGGSRYGQRPIIRAASHLNLPLAVYGPNWDKFIAPKHCSGEKVAADKLANLYANAAVVLNDHLPTMRSGGFFSNRILDAVASGALVISDPIKDLPEALAQYVFTVPTAEALKRAWYEAVKMGQALSQTERLRMHETIKADYSFELRAKQIIADARSLLARGLNYRLLDFHIPSQIQKNSKRPEFAVHAVCCGADDDLPETQITTPNDKIPWVKMADLPTLLDRHTSNKFKEIIVMARGNADIKMLKELVEKYRISLSLIYLSVPLDDTQLQNTKENYHLIEDIFAQRIMFCCSLIDLLAISSKNTWLDLSEINAAGELLVKPCTAMVSHPAVKAILKSAKAYSGNANRGIA